MTTNKQMQRFLGGVEQGFLPIDNTTGPITIDKSDAVVRVDTSTGAIGAITLPNDVPVGTEREHDIFDVGGMANTNQITIFAPGGGSIDGNASIVIGSPWGGVTLSTSDGLNYTTGGSSGGGGVVGPSNAVYVDPAGNDATGTRGNAAFPFLTIEAAFAATHDGDEVLIAPGFFSPLVPLTPPPGVVSLIIRGSGEVLTTDNTSDPGGTIISDVNLGGMPVFDFTNLIDYVLFDDLSIAEDGGSIGINLDGTTSGGLFGLHGVFVHNVRSSIIAKYVNNIRWTAGEVLGTCNITTCSTVVFDATNHGFVTFIDWNDADPLKPTTARDAVYLQGSHFPGLFLGGQAALDVDASSRLITIDGNALSVANGLALRLVCRGRVDNNVDFSSVAGKRLPDTAVVCVVDFDGALFNGATIAFSVAGAPPVNRQTVTMRNATIANPACVVTANAAIDIDVRDTSWGSGTSRVTGGAPLGTFTYSNVITPAQIVADTNDWAFTGLSTATHVRVDTNAAWSLTGITTGAGGRTMYLEYVGAVSLVLNSENAGSAAANRFLFDSDVILIPNNGVMLMYDATSLRWRKALP